MNTTGIKIRHKDPPQRLYKALQDKFGPMVDYDKGLVIAYGTEIYSKAQIPPWILAHETVHCQRQMDMGLTEWWKAYIDNPDFRLNEEILAFQAEVKSYKKYMNPVTDFYTKQRAKLLSSKLYGELITYEEALEYLLITN